jgi:RNA polymerase sigma factor (TIGR02999 family)
MTTLSADPLPPAACTAEAGMFRSGTRANASRARQPSAVSSASAAVASKPAIALPEWLMQGAAGRQGRDVDYAKLAAEWQNGDRDAGNELFVALGSELRVIAAARLRHERNCSLSVGDLVNEAILKLFRLNVMELQSRAHILALASRVMRQILIDEARKRGTAKRQHAAITLTTNIAQWEMPVDLMMIESALHDLAKIDPQRAQIVEMRFFGGMSTGDIADVLGVSEPTVKRRWASTRAWLRHRLGQP